MASPTGGGGKFTLIQKKFNINTTTLSEVVDMYIEETLKTKPKFKGAAHRASFNAKPFIKEFMNKPVIDFLEASTDDELNPLMKVYDQTDSVGVKRKYYSLFKGIEANIQSQVNRTSGDSLSHYKSNGIPKLTETVILDSKPGARSAKFAFNHLKAGEFQFALLEHAKKFPKDVPVVRATLAMLHLGFRTNEIQMMPMDALKPAMTGSVAPGLFIGADQTKMDYNIDIPASSKVHGILQSSISHNKLRFKDLAEVPNMMFLTSDGKQLKVDAINTLLKQIKVTGIMQNKETGEMLDYLTSSYDLRRFNSTIAYKKKIPIQIMAQMKGRAIQATDAGGEILYPSPMSGLYDGEDLKYHEVLSDHISNQLDAEFEKRGLFSSVDKTLASNQDLVLNYVEDKAIKTIDTGTAQSFSKTVDLSQETFKTPTLDTADANAVIEGEYAIIDADKPPELPKSFDDFSEEELAQLKKVGITDNRMNKNSTVLQTIKETGKKIIDSKTGKAAITVAGAVASTVAKSSPIVAGGLEYQMSKDEGKGEFESISRGAAEAVNPLPVGLRDAEVVKEAVAEKTADDASISDSGSFLDALTGSLTGQQLNLSGGFASGGFVNRQNRR